MVVFRPTVRKKERIAPEAIAAPDRLSYLVARLGVRLQLLRAVAQDARERGQHKGRVEVVRPALVRVGAVGPRAVRALPPRDVARRAQRVLAPDLRAGDGARRGQRLARQQARVKDARAVERRVAEADLLVGLVRASEVSEDELAGAGEGGHVIPDAARDRALL